MADPEELTPARAVLLAVHFAVNTNISAFEQLTALHSTVLNPVLSLRILLTFLPESMEPALYISYLQNLVQSSFGASDDIDIDTSTVEKLTDTDARRRVRKLGLLPLEYPKARHGSSSEDPLTLFLIHRAHKIDAETGLLPLLPQLLEPFLHHSQYIRTWMISTLLPLLRLNYEFYPHDEPKFSLEVFEQLSENVGASLLLSKAGQSNRHRNAADRIVARDLRGLVGPWMYGHTRNKRRKVVVGGRRQSLVARLEEVHTGEEEVHRPNDEEIQNWEEVHEWLLSEAARDFSIVVQGIEHWDGPPDVDYGGYDAGQDDLDEAKQRSLTSRYAQAALAAVFATRDSSTKTLKASHRVLVRVTELLGLPRPPDLDAAAHSLPEVNLSSNIIDNISTSHLLHRALLLPSNPITTPNTQAISLLFALLLSASLLVKIDGPFSVLRVAELYLSGDAASQRSELQKVIRNISSGIKRREEEWTTFRATALWLWGWGKDYRDQPSAGDTKEQHGAGVFGKVEKSFLEMEVLRAFLLGQCMLS